MPHAVIWDSRCHFALTPVSLFVQSGRGISPALCC